ncbi:hypothetical protein FH609_017875 [Streptomyces sp. 3MP-14]|uniref:Uncharacterized protein n=1 Tax=Streptomyces mimosae TaxID=2586635 RepID=A0A5N6A8N3_9ACTN|nr:MULTISPECIES: hypothetical protein [Streptomyces]KAB8164592.1 hypothetical protein FH607_015200 [Streptomyces mimosae]KAB8175508.1 hypothetical protein FH609_017875 [Streptomyces sp. 3MP-14]
MTPLRERADQTDLFRATRPLGVIAPNGVRAVLDELTGTAGGGERDVLITGSYAAKAVAPSARANGCWTELAVQALAGDVPESRVRALAPRYVARLGAGSGA